MDTPVKLTIIEKENSPGCYEVNRTDLTGSQGGMSPSSRLLLLNAIAGLTGRDRRKYEKKLERAWKEPPILPKGDRTPPSARLIKAKSKKSPKRNKIKPGSPVKKRKTTSRKTVAARRPEVADAAGSAAPEPTAPANTKADRATCSGGQQGQVAAEQSACAVTASAPPEAAGRLRPEVNAQKHEGAEASARGRRKETDTAGAGSPPRGNAGAEEPRSVAEVCAEGSERCGGSAEIATQEIDDEGFQLAHPSAEQQTAQASAHQHHTKAAAHPGSGEGDRAREQSPQVCGRLPEPTASPEHVQERSGTDRAPRGEAPAVAERATGGPRHNEMSATGGPQRAVTTDVELAHADVHTTDADEDGFILAKRTRPDHHVGQRQQPTAPPTASPERATAPTAEPNAQVARRPRRRRRRAGRATRAAAQQTATVTPPQQRQAARAAQRQQPDTATPRQATPPERTQPAAPVAEVDPHFLS
ncbi:immunoglobulin A1 protease autotransporter-like [Schistocerca cancellata]|uniref:immunoglobulin A1 protease autotransporter-like n=1 Tax=Schistocerca cancellata TaxID=274614 RepID=UPI0021196918|nr:immunoglobulin A1 protease autotransporter-like [Schistocerca cancellata]